MDSAGDFVIAWESGGGEDGSDYGIYAQRYNASGAAQGSQFLVNTYTTNFQTAPSVALDAEGDFVIAWASLGEDGGVGYGIYAQRYNAKGATQGSQFQVSSSTTATQQSASVAMDTNGDFVIAWNGSEDDTYQYYGGSQYGVYAQVYTAAGAIQGSNFQVNTYATGFQDLPAVAMDEEGDFVVAWQSGDPGSHAGNIGQDGSLYGVYARRYTPIYEFQVNTYTTGSDQGPKVASDAEGDYVVVWEGFGQDGTLFGIYAQRYNAAGVAQGSNFQVDAATTNQVVPSVAMDSAGDFVIAWQASDGSLYGVYAQRTIRPAWPRGASSESIRTQPASRKNPRWPWIRPGISSSLGALTTWTAANMASTPSATIQPAWPKGATSRSIPTRRAISSSPRRPWIRRAISSSPGRASRTASATASTRARTIRPAQLQGSEFQVSTFTAGSEVNASAAMDSAGGFVIAWESGSGEDGSEYGVYAQRYNSIGAAQGSNFQVNTYTTFSQEDPSAAMDSEGDFVITWVSYQDGGSGTNSPQYGIYGQRYNSAGAAQQSEFRVNSYTTNQQELPAVAMDSEGDFVVTWQSFGQGGSEYGVYARRYNAILTSTAPVVTTTGSALSYTANSGPQDVDPGVTVTDSESSNITSATVSISSGYVSSEDVLAFATEGNISGSFTIGSGTLVLSGTATVAQYQTALEAVTYDDVDHDATTASRTVSFTVNDGTSVSNTATRIVNPLADVVTQLAITTQPPATVTAGNGFGFTITAKDSQNNVVNTFTGSETVALVANPGSSTLGGTLTISAVNGVAAFSGLTLNKVGSGYTLDVTNGTLTSATSSAITVTPAAASKLLVSTSASSLSAGGTTSVSITAEDQFNNVVTSFSDSVTLADSVAGATFSTLSFTAGKAAVTTTLDTVGTQTITATDATATISGTSGSISVTPAAASKLLVSTLPSSLSAGGTTSISITAEDQFNNVVTGFSDSVTLADGLGGATFPALSFTGGKATVTATLDTAGTQTITATDSTATISATSGSISVTPAAASKLLVSALPSSLSAGSTTSVSVTAEDQFNNVVTGFSDSVTLADSLASATFSALSFTGGKATTTATLHTAGTQTITATDSTATISGTSGSISVTPAAANKLLVSTSASSLSAGGTTSVSITAEDQFNNVVTGFSDSVTLADSLGGATFPALSFTGGKATVTATLDTAGTQTITATDSTATVSGTSGSVTVTPAAASKLLVSTSPSSLSAGGTTSVSITAEDQFNNVVTGFSDSVTLVDSLASATFSALSFTSGKATATATLHTAGTQTITATDATVTISGTSGSVTVTPAAASKLLVSTLPSSLSAGGTTSVSITAEDQFNNVVTGFSDSVTLADSLANATFSALSFTSGKATVTATLDTVGTQTITATDATATISGTSGSISVTPAAASKLLVSTSASSLSAGGTTSVSITAEDQFNNVVTGFSDSVTLADSLGGATFSALSFTSGKATVAATLDTAGTQTITATDSTATISGTSGSISVTPAAASKLLVSTSPNSLSAGSTTSVSVTAEDQFNNVVTGFSDSVTLADSLGAATFSALSFTGGKATATATLHTAGTQTITATDSTATISGTSGSVTVTPAAASKLLVSTSASSLSAGGTTSVSITAEDQFNNVVTGFSDSVTLADSLGGATFSALSFTGGKATVTATLDTAGTQTITATDATATISGTSGSISVTPAAASKLLVSASPSSLSAGSTSSVSITAEDQFNNVVTGFSDSVTLADSLASATFSALSFTSGKATAIATLHTAGTQTLTATDATATISGTSGSISVTPAAASKLLMSTSVSSLSAGGTTSVSITAEDQFNNVVTGFSDSVTLADSLAGATFSALSFTSGKATVTATLDMVGTQTITATDATATISATSGSLTVTPAAVSKLLVSTSASSLSAGGTTSVSITAEDQYNNVVTGFSDSVTLADSLGGATFSALSFTSGKATVTATLDTAGPQTIKATDSTATISGTSSSITVTPGVATHLFITSEPPSTVTVSSGFSFTVAAEDAEDNVATAFSGSETVALVANPGSSTLGGILTVSANSGIATFSGLTLNNAGSGYTLGVTGGTLTSATSSAIAVSSVTPTQLVITSQPPSTVTAGSGFTFTVTAEDSQDNIAVGFNGSETVALASNPGSSSLGGLITVSAISGVATFSGLTLNKVDGGYTLSVTTATLTSATSNPVTVIPAAASMLLVSASPSSLSAGSTTSVSITAEDQFNNVVTGFSDSVTLADSLAGATFSALSFTGGKATATATLDTAGTQTITATDATATISGTGGSVTVTPAAASKLLVSTSASNLSAGGTTSVNITAEDQYNNVVTGFSDSVTLVDSLGGASFAAVSFSSGLATATATLDTSGTQTITATDSTATISGTSGALTVTPLAASKLLISVSPSSPTAGSTSSVTITAEDQFNNIATSFSDSVTLSDSLGGASFSSASFTGGNATVAATLDTASTQTLTATDQAATISGTSSGISVTPGAATQLLIASQPPSTVAAGTGFALTVTAEDAYNNVATGFSGSETVALLANPGGSTLSGTLTAGATSGVASFSGLALNNTGSGYTLLIASAGLTSATSGSFAVVANAPSLSDPGFELPALATGAYQYNPNGSPWTFSGDAGVANNNSAFTTGNPSAPQGNQVAFLQITGSASQSVTFAGGTYSISFDAAQCALDPRTKRSRCWSTARSSAPSRPAAPATRCIRRRLSASRPAHTRLSSWASIQRGATTRPWSTPSPFKPIRRTSRPIPDLSCQPWRRGHTSTIRRARPGRSVDTQEWPATAAPSRRAIPTLRKAARWPSFKLRVR